MLLFHLELEGRKKGGSCIIVGESALKSEAFFTALEAVRTRLHVYSFVLTCFFNFLEILRPFGL